MNVKTIVVIAAGVTVIAVAAGVVGYQAATRANKTEEVLASTVSQNESRLTLAPAPTFVIEHDLPDPNTASAEPLQGLQFLLMDAQHDATDPHRPIYTRQAIHALSGVGAQHIGVYYIIFDPSFQHAELNHLRIIRNGITEDRSTRFSVTFVQREELMTLQILTGIVTAVVRIEDVRAGDILDIAFTLKGAPPSFGKREVRQFPIANTAAVEQFSLRSIWPGHVNASMSFGGPTVNLERDGAKTIATIAPQPLPAFDMEAALLSPNTLSSTLTLTNYTNWAEVVEWGRPYYADRHDPIVPAILKPILDANSTKADQIVAALRYTQNEIRYAATTFGDGSYIPQRPSETIKIGAGDCKAKVLLFLSLMDALGVKATAAFANIGEGYLLKSFPASPLTFNHVIARVEFDGKTFWVDPTITHQGGNLQTMAQPNYGHALVLEDYTLGLTSMDSPKGSKSLIEINEIYDLSKGAASGDVKVKIIYRGAIADLIRQSLSILSEDQQSENLTNYYKRYGEVEEFNFLTHDDAETNTIITEITFNISSPFRKPKNNGKRYFYMKAHGITALLKKIPENAPKAPIPISPFTHVEHKISVILPESKKWRLHPSSEFISNAAFDYSMKSEKIGDKFHFTNKLFTKVFVVQPDDYAQLYLDQEDMLDASEYKLWMTDDSSNQLTIINEMDFTSILPPTENK